MDSQALWEWVILGIGIAGGWAWGHRVAVDKCRDILSDLHLDLGRKNTQIAEMNDTVRRLEAEITRLRSEGGRR